jgi:cathepsin L
MMKSILLVCLFATAALAFKAELNKEWELFKQVHGRKFSPSENLKRRAIWEEAVEKVATHNRRFDMGLTTYRKGVNKFADLTYEEFSKLYTSKTMPIKKGIRNLHVKSNAPRAGEVDWRNQGAVTDVKDQGQCGSCWSFSATGSLEGQWFLNKGQLLSLSEQNLVDCSGSYGNQGCNGGLMDQAFDYIRDNGIMSEDDYPYNAYDGNCQFDSSRVVATVQSYTDVAQGDEDALTDAIHRVGPIAVGIDASSQFQSYSGGVLDDYECSPYALNHGVLAVGYGNDGSDYYLVKNSWGSGWGENGYIRMSRNKDNQCGIASTASYPTV